MVRQGDPSMSVGRRGGEGRMMTKRIAAWIVTVALVASGVSAAARSMLVSADDATYCQPQYVP